MYKCFFFLACLFVSTAASADDHNPFEDQEIEWRQIRHFIDGEEIPGAPIARINGIGWVIVMPNYWTGFVRVPDCAPSINAQMEDLKAIRWWSEFLPLIIPNSESDYYREGGYPLPKSKRGRAPGVQLFYANRQTQVFFDDGLHTECAENGVEIR